jgi:calcineurin-like phosphoesterase family protein
MGLGQYVSPRFAVHITSAAAGHEIPIDRLRASCLWYPGRALSSVDGQQVSGFVLYVSPPLLDALETALEIALEVEDPEVDVEGGEPGVSHRLTASIAASKFATVRQLLAAILKRVQQALPVTKRKLLAELVPEDPDLLRKIEEILQAQGLHVLVPLQVGRSYQLITDATEALLPVSPNELKRNPRLCFVLLSTDVLEDRRESPWLRQVAQIMALPVIAPRAPRDVLRFVLDMPVLQAVYKDEQLCWELAQAMHDVTGGWPDLCDRFYARLLRLKDIEELRDLLRDLSRLLRLGEHDPGRHGEELLALALGSAGAGPGAAGALDLPDLPPLRPQSGGEGAFGIGGGHDALLALMAQPGPFTWQDHGRAYLDGVIGWDRGMAVPRSPLIGLCLRGRLARIGIGAGSSRASQVTAGSPGPAAPDAADPIRPPGPRTVRWLHVSDFHFTARAGADRDMVLDALVDTVTDLYRHGRRVDLIFITGDIAQSGAPEEYVRAEAYLRRLCEAAHVDPGAVHLVPGNHDVYRPNGEGLARTLTDHQMVLRYFEDRPHRPHLLKLEAFRAFYDRFYQGARRAAPGHATALAEIVRVRELDLGILPLNTAWFAQDDQDAGKLLIGEPVVRAGLNVLAGATLRISLMHHPVSDLSELERRLIGERLAENCHFVLRGHLHDTEAQKISTAYQQSLSLAAGASYQGRTPYQNRALFVEAEVVPEQQLVQVRPYPIRYEMTGHDRWTLDTSVFPRSYPTYLETLSISLQKK